MIYFLQLIYFIILKGKNLNNFLFLQHMENIDSVAMWLLLMLFCVISRKNGFLPNDDNSVTFNSYLQLLQFIDYMNLCIVFHMIFVLKSFLINSISPKKKKSNSWEKAITDNLPFLSHLSFETRNRLNSCVRNQLTCSFRIAFQSKTRLSNLKLVSAIFYQILIFSSNDRPLKTMKNVFYFI